MPSHAHGLHDWRTLEGVLSLASFKSEESLQGEVVVREFSSGLPVVVIIRWSLE